MKTWIDVVESQKPKKDMQMPYFTNEAWLFIFLSLGFFMGVAGAILYTMMLMPFVK